MVSLLLNVSSFSLNFSPIITRSCRAIAENPTNFAINYCSLLVSDTLIGIFNVIYLCCVVPGLIFRHNHFWVKFITKYFLSLLFLTSCFLCYFFRAPITKHYWPASTIVENRSLRLTYVAEWLSKASSWLKSFIRILS